MNQKKTLKPNFFPKPTYPRFVIVAGVFALIMGLVLIKAFRLMTVEKDTWNALAASQEIKGRPIVPMRGNILADNGEVLAASIPEYKLYLDFMTLETDSARAARNQLKRDTILENHMDEICNGLHDIFPDIDPAQMRKHLEEGRRKEAKRWPIVKRLVSYIDYCRVLELPLFRESYYTGGFHTDKYSKRINPYGKLAPRTVGDMKFMTDSARTGLELAFDSILRGRPGVKHREKVLNRFIDKVDVPVEDGLDVQTTLNIRMQDLVEQSLRDELETLERVNGAHVNFGICILMEVATGDIKAISSLSRTANGQFVELQNRAVSNLMEPGSVFKPMSFLVAFNDGYIGMNDPVDVGNGIRKMYNRNMTDHNVRSGGYGLITVRECIQKSSNVGVSHFIDKYYHSDPDRFVDGIYATGVADDLHLPIPGYAKPRIKRPRDVGDLWAKTDLPWMSIGYVTQIPPISTLTFYNGIANNGRMMRPRFVKALLKNGEVVQTYDPVVVREQMAKPEAVKNIQTCLREVVTLGVGKSAASKLVTTAGKTGTAQVWSAHGKTREHLVSFAGFFPYEKPLYSCIVCINGSGVIGGNYASAPVFRKVAEGVMAMQSSPDYHKAKDENAMLVPTVHRGNVSAASRVLREVGTSSSGYTSNDPADHTWGKANGRSNSLRLEKDLALKANEMPDVVGYGLRDAVFRLEQLGLRVKASGVGQVRRQSTKPGQFVQHGDTIYLQLSTDALKNDSDEPEPLPDGDEDGTDNAPQPANAATEPASPPKPQAD